LLPILDHFNLPINSEALDTCYSREALPKAAIRHEAVAYSKIYQVLLRPQKRVRWTAEENAMLLQMRNDSCSSEALASQRSKPSSSYNNGSLSDSKPSIVAIMTDIRARTSWAVQARASRASNTTLAKRKPRPMARSTSISAAATWISTGKCLVKFRFKLEF
jgi:hypothetical protein